MPESGKRISVVFFRTASETEPVREWLQSLSREDRRTIGEDLRTLEWGWPIGMPTCRPLEKGLWEVRSNLTYGRIGRLIFYIADSKMVILHGFVKKSQKTPRRDIELAINRRKDIER